MAGTASHDKEWGRDESLHPGHAFYFHQFTVSVKVVEAVINPLTESVPVKVTV